MKIYINHFNLNILPELKKKFYEYRVKTEEYMQIYSSDGIYIVDHSATLKLNPVDHDIVILSDFYKNFTLIVDPSFFIVEKSGQIPPDHISRKILRDTFALTHQNKVKLVIESEIQTECTDAFSLLNKSNTENAFQYKDVYFELPNGTNIKDALVKEQIIEFLSLLN
jgi:hypothetical protein